jgi:hypothetical protein
MGSGFISVIEFVAGQLMAMFVRLLGQTSAVANRLSTKIRVVSEPARSATWAAAGPTTLRFPQESSSER